MARKHLYHVHDGKKYMGLFGAEIAEKALGIKGDKISQYCRRGIKYQGRYTFSLEEDKTPSKKKKLANDWDFTTRMILQAGKGRKHGCR